MYIRRYIVEEIHVSQTLDVRGFNCPIPVLKTRQALTGMPSGEVLEVVSSDPGSRKDMKALIERLGHELLDTSESGSQISYYIRKK
jgi:tRNA 2-thiouridine synthesizing protein A